MLGGALRLAPCAGPPGLAPGPAPGCASGNGESLGSAPRLLLSLSLCAAYIGYVRKTKNSM
eukprot:15483088-Alexandrium_andersonii.AAC.1